jgi:hypothetical protein
MSMMRSKEDMDTVCESSPVCVPAFGMHTSSRGHAAKYSPNMRMSSSSEPVSACSSSVRTSATPRAAL